MKEIYVKQICIIIFLFEALHCTFALHPQEHISREEF